MNFAPFAPFTKSALYAGACAAALAMTAPSVANAADIGMPGGNPWYISMFGGVSFPETVKGRFLYSTTIQYTVRSKFKDGFIVGLAAGANDVIMPRLRAEVEFAFASHNPKSRVETAPTGVVYTYAGNGGSLDSYTILANLWYDFDTGTALTPFIGGGVGIGIVDSNLRYVSGFGPAAFNDSDVGFAFQAGAGVKYAITPAVTLDLSYRFRGIVDFSLKENSGALPNQGPDKGLDLYTHNILVGFTYNFNTP